MEKRGIIDEENTPPEEPGCGTQGKCGTASSQKETADQLEDGPTTRLAKHAEQKTNQKK